MDQAAIDVELLAELRELLQQSGPTEAALQTMLDRVVERFGCAVGTMHRWDAVAGLLQLQVQRGLPAALLDRVRQIPLGKGMAGIAAERREPVQVCNLQTDVSGVAQARAKETRMEGSVAVPMLVGGEVRGVLGVAKPVAYEFTAAECTLLLEIAAAIGSAI